jgi:hypothetical protein
MDMKKTVVLISGKLHSGKNTFADALVLHAKAAGLTVDMGLLALPLKDGCKEDFQDMAVYLKKQYQLLVDQGVPPAVVSWMLLEDENFYEDKTVLSRILLQIYGTNIFRNRVDPDYWLEKYLEKIIESTADLLVITDWRFPNECSVVTEAGGHYDFRTVAVRIERPDLSRDGLENQHFSEKALDDYNLFDYTYINQGTLEQLSAASRWLLDKRLIPEN